MNPKVRTIKCCVCGKTAIYPDCMSTKKPKEEWWYQMAQSFYCPDTNCRKVAMDGGRR